MSTNCKIELVAKMLQSTSNGWQYQSTIIESIDMPTSEIVRCLPWLVESGLVVHSRITDLYRTSETGLLFLARYDELLEFIHVMIRQSIQNERADHAEQAGAQASM